MVLNAIAFILAMVVMFPLVSKTYAYINENPVELSQPESLSRFTDEVTGLPGLSLPLCR